MDTALKKLLDGKWTHVTYLKLKGLLVSHRIVLRQELIDELNKFNLNYNTACKKLENGEWSPETFM